MMRCGQFRTFTATAVLAFTMLLTGTGCENDLSDRVLGVESTGTVILLLFRDENLNGTFNTNVDSQLRTTRHILLRTATRKDSIHRTTDSLGFSLIVAPVGRYRVELPPVVMGDTVERISPDLEFTISDRDTLVVTVGVRYPSFTVSEARNLPIGRKVWVKGVALNTRATFGDNAMHLADSIAAIRMLGVPPTNIQPGDSVQLLGTRGVTDGQPTFNVISALNRGSTGALPVPLTLSTAQASTAAGGLRDAALVNVRSATISNAVTTPEGRVLTVSDGTGDLTILMDAAINFGNAAQLNAFSPPARIDATGLLVPDEASPGHWLLKPRARADLIILP